MRRTPPPAAMPRRPGTGAGRARGSSAAGTAAAAWPRRRRPIAAGSGMAPEVGRQRVELGGGDGLEAAELLLELGAEGGGVADQHHDAALRVDAGGGEALDRGRRDRGDAIAVAVQELPAETVAEGGQDPS